jgi:hypothetical protein
MLCVCGVAKWFGAVKLGLVQGWKGLGDDVSCWLLSSCFLRVFVARLYGCCGAEAGAGEGFKYLTWRLCFWHCTAVCL